MRSTLAAAILALALTPAWANAQTSPSAPPAPAAPAADATTSGKPAATGITREQYIERAKDRAAQRAAARFDRLDANHDGVLDSAEMRAWRRDHPRQAKAPATSTSPQ